MSFIQRNKSKIGLAILALGFSSTTYGVLYGFGPAEAWTIAKIADLTAEVTLDIGTFGSTFASQMELSSEQIISALAVATKQEAVSANEIADNNRKTVSMVAEALAAQSENDQVISATIRYDAALGQGYDPCGTALKNKTTDMAFNNARTNAIAAMQTYDVAPGRLVPSDMRALADRLDTHRSKFCTPSEAAANICSLSTLPGADTNAAMIYESAAPNSLEKEARKAYIQNVLGAPDSKVSKAVGATSAGEEYFVAKNRKDALLSIPAYSLAMIDAANTQDPAADNKSPNELMKLRVNQYFGGKEAEDWSGAMARQAERGLLVEANRVGGLEVWMHYKQYEQNQRINANLAALLIASADRLQPSIDAQYKRALLVTSRSAINN